jgi:hypothetical protein
VVDEERAPGNGVDGPAVEEEATRGGRNVDGMHVSHGGEAAEPMGRCEVEPQVPAVELALGERNGEHDARVLELVLIARARAPAPPEGQVGPEARTHRLLRSHHVVVLYLHRYR